jgi:hypothetical protein
VAVQSRKRRVSSGVETVTVAVALRIFLQGRVRHNKNIPCSRLWSQP